MLAFGNYFIVIMCVMGMNGILAYVEIGTMVEEKFFEYILEEHNEYRKLHGSPRLLVLSDFCSRKANEPLRKMMSIPYSEEYLNECGENTFSMHLDDVSKLNAELAKKIVASWYETGKNYNYLAKPNNNDADAFTQIVWEDTSQLGLQMVLTEGGILYVAANYFVKGNIKEKYLDNVKKPELSRVNISWVINLRD